MKCVFLVAWILVCVTGTPVERVVGLIEDLKTRLETDGKTEQLAYDRFACWADKTSKAKAEAIETAQSNLQVLQQDILKLKGRVATLSSEIAEHGAALKANEEAQSELTSIRQSENTEFTATSEELKQAAAALQKAITVLNAATNPASGTALVQTQAASRSLQDVVSKTSAWAAAMLPADKLNLLQEAAKDGYAPQSMTINGILTDMYDTFTTDLMEKTKEESERWRAFEDIMHTKQEEHEELTVLKQQKESLKAEAEAGLAEKTQTYSDTERQMKADTVFFDEVKASASAKSSEWTERSRLRALELEYVTKALNLLSSDGAREVFGNAFFAGVSSTTLAPAVQTTLASSFLQVGGRRAATGATQAKHAAYSALKRIAKGSHSYKLAKLAASVGMAKTGHFGKVLQSIATTIQDLKDEEAADIAKRDECKSEYQNTDSSVADLEWKIKTNVATIDELEKTITKHNADKTAAEEEHATVSQQIKDMQTERNAANQAFLTAKSDDEAAIAILQRTTEALSNYRDKEGHPALIQQEPVFEVSADRAPVADFADKHSARGETDGILKLLEVITEDLQTEISNSERDEAGQVLSFEKATAAAQKVVDGLTARMDNLRGQIADRTTDKESEGEKKVDNEADLTAQETYRSKIKPDCDWIIGAFAERRDRRKTEMDGLAGAKDYLAGYQDNSVAEGDALVQSRKSAIRRSHGYFLASDE